MSNHEPTAPYVYQPGPCLGLSGDPAQWRIYGVSGPFDISEGLTKAEAQAILAILQAKAAP